MAEAKGVSVFKRHATDTGSPEFQIGLLSDEITTLQAHLQNAPKDYDAKRSLLKKVAKWRRLLKYIKAGDVETYTKVSKKIGVRV